MLNLELLLQTLSEWHTAGSIENALYKLLNIDTLLNSTPEIQEIIQFASCCGAIVCEGEGAINPHTQHFRDFPAWVDSYLAPLIEKVKPSFGSIVHFRMEKIIQ